MGIDLHVLSFLLANKKHLSGRTLLLGRQEIHINPLDERVNRIAAEFGFAATDLVRAIEGEQYAEKLLQTLGCGDIFSMDMSSFEGAQIIHDLNIPVPESLCNSFDFILDGGTLEHVFNFPQAIDNVKKMLRVHGAFIFINGANNMLGHGLYQFSPELLWRLFKQPGSYTVEQMRLVDTSQIFAWTEAPDPMSLGYRNEISTTHGPTYLMMSAQRIGSDMAASIYQSDYSAQWEKIDQEKH